MVLVSEVGLVLLGLGVCWFFGGCWVEVSGIFYFVDFFVVVVGEV